jgi:hypothetical protein
MSAALFVAALAAGCGGGGTSASGGGTSSGLLSNDVSIATTKLTAGQSTAIAAHAIIRGAIPNSMKWTANPLQAVNSGDASPVFADINCASATFAPPAVAGASGEGACQTVLTVPPTAKAGQWRITNTAASATAGSVSNSVDIEIVALPTSGFQLLESSTPLTGYVNKPLTMNIPFTVNPGVNVTNLKYSWSASGQNASVVAIAGAHNSTATVTPLAAGQYTFNVVVSADINGFTETTSGAVVANVNPTNFTDVLDAGLPQIVTANSVVSLNGTIINRDNTLTYQTSWSQMTGTYGGPETIRLNNANSSNASFIAPTTEGVYGFEYKVIKNQADGTQAITTAQTTVIVKKAVSPVFTVSAGDAQTVAVGASTTLRGSVGAQGNSAGVVYTYAWTQVGSTPTTAFISNPNAATASFIPTVAGTYTFQLTVTATTSAGVTTVAGTTQVVVTGSGTTPFSVIADAGPAQIAAPSSVVTLTGAQTVQGTATGVIYSYAWTQVGTTPATVTLAGANTKIASFIPTTVGTYNFTFTVTATLPDGTVKTSSSDTQVIIKSASSGSNSFAMTANAGAAQIVAPNAVVSLVGTQTTQGTATGVTYAYAWTQVGTTPATPVLSNANTATATFVPTTAGTYTYTLTVTATLADGTTQTATSNTQVVVGASGTAFSVNAGAAQKVAVSTPTTMTGTYTTQGSFSGATFSYQWTQIGTAPAVATISNSNSLVASFLPDTAGTYTFQLTVTSVMGGVTTSQNAQTQILVTP